ncbi:MAG: hypothetical protein JNM57_06395 [Cyclobacteriaceae bacterium]|nr:hypothetical protein [Cyclobacteriaceae bacterium]
MIIPAFSQNTKGDKPAANREGRFKTPFKKSQKKGPSGKRVKSKGKSFANSGRVNAPSGGARSASGKVSNVYPQRGPYANRKPSETQRQVSNNYALKRLKRLQGSSSARTSNRNIYPQNGPYVHNPSSKPASRQRPVSNRATLNRLKRLQGPEPSKPDRKKVVVPRSASGSFIARKSPNTWAQFPRPKKKGEVAVTKDIAGRKLRTKNYETQRPGIIAPTFEPYKGRKRVGDRPYKGPSGGGYVSATKSGQRAWTGDIAGRTIRGRNYFSKGKSTEGQPLSQPRRKKPARGDKVYRGTVPGSGYKSLSRSGETRPGKAALPVRTPGIGAKGIGNFQGNIKGRRPLKGGGSVSGKSWNNRQTPLAVRTPGRGADRIGNFQGTLKAGRPLKGGGSVSGKMWNNRQTPLPVRTPSGNAARAGNFSGNINLARSRHIFSDQGEEYTGHLKASKRPKNIGASLSGKIWNNRESAVPTRAPSNNTLKAARFAGNLKSSKPQKGGGSMSGKLWNNKETPLPVKTPSGETAKAVRYSGNLKNSKQHITVDQGEEFTGVIKLKKFNRSYAKNPNASDDALKKKSPDKSTYKVDDLQVRVKRPRYVENPNSAEEALLKLKPNKSTYQVGELQVKIKQKETGTKPHAADGSLPGIKPTKSSVKASEYAKGVKRTWNYVHNPSSAEEALRVREPGKAFARATDYQGNIKMRKYDLFGKPNLHPDAQFVKTNKNNVAEEKDMLTNFKLWWARLFKKNETLPDHLKDKGHKPRYDKGEQGLWYD